MTFSELDNIWTADLSGLSNADRGRVFFERAKQIVHTALTNLAEHGHAVLGNRFRRDYLTAKIGCQPAVTTQNPKIKKLLIEADLRIREECVKAGPSSICFQPNLMVQRTLSNWPLVKAARTARPEQRRAIGAIVATDVTCELTGQSWPGIPTLVWPEGIDESASDWLRYLVVAERWATSTAHEYAKIIRPFLRYCREQRRAWSTVDDEFLTRWREYLLRAKGVGARRVNTSLVIIFAFFRWAEEKKILRYQVGIYLDDDLPVPLSEIVFPISAKRVLVRAGRGRAHWIWTSPLTISDDFRGAPRHTPSEDEIRRLHDVTVSHLHGERDSLMFSWAEEAGPRRKEVLALELSHMPTSDELAGLIERDEPWPILVKRKGKQLNAAAPLYASPDLLIRTIDYIEFGRREIVVQCRSELVGYREPNAIFLSSTTGMSLHPDSVTAIGRRAFGEAGIERANIHRLRARYAVRIVETLVEAVFASEMMIGADSTWVETILEKAAQMMGHSHPRSLKPYLTYVLNRRIQTADSTKAAQLAARIRQMTLYEGTLVRRLQSIRDLGAVAKLIQSSQYTDALKGLNVISENIAAVS